MRGHVGDRGVVSQNGRGSRVRGRGLRGAAPGGLSEIGAHFRATFPVSLRQGRPRPPEHSCFGRAPLPFSSPQVSGARELVGNNGEGKVFNLDVSGVQRGRGGEVGDHDRISGF